MELYVAASVVGAESEIEVVNEDKRGESESDGPEGDDKGLKETELGRAIGIGVYDSICPVILIESKEMIKATSPWSPIKVSSCETPLQGGFASFLCCPRAIVGIVTVRLEFGSAIVIVWSLLL